MSSEANAGKLSQVLLDGQVNANRRTVNGTGETVEGSSGGGPGPECEFEVLSWAAYGAAATVLAQKVVDSGYRPEVIVAIARGGLFPGGSLGYALSVKRLFVVNMEYYTGMNERRDVPVMLPPFLKSEDLVGASVLVVDDVSDTGHTLRAVLDCIGESAQTVRTAVLYEKPRTVVHCDYVWRYVDRWIRFPWSSNAPLLLPDGAVPAAE